LFFKPHASGFCQALAETSGRCYSTPVVAEPVRWNLGELYEGPDDPRLAADAREARERTERFAAEWRGVLTTASASDICRALVAYEDVLELGQRPGFYASLLAAAEGGRPEALDLEQRTTEEQADLRALLVFVELELTAIDDQRFAELIADPALAEYAHFLRALRRFKPHLLSEPEERLLTRKHVSGPSSFVQLFDELAGSLRFRVRVDGADRVLTDGEVMALLHHPDRDLRTRALRALLGEYAAQALPIAAVTNALVLDHRMDCELRGYRHVAEPTHLANELEPETVEVMMDVVERHYPVIRRFLQLKAKLLNLPRLGSADVYAPIDDADDSMPFAKARTVIVDAFGRFNGAFADLAEAFFDGRWIDAEIRPGKRLGAFCAAWTPRHHPYVLASYAGTSRDVATLAHELGHGIHYTLARRQTLLNYDPPLVLAETASVFAEMLVTDHLLRLAPDAVRRRRILVATLDEMYGTVFRQHALTRFELALHAARREKRLSADEIGTLWWESQRVLHDDAVEMDPAYRHGWSYIPHFVHSRFYCYAYAFGELLTLALFQRYLHEGAAFLPVYTEILASGGSLEPTALLRRYGIDLTSASFWEAGCGAIAAMVDELAALCR
jgi:oligoendopeptidase F